MEVVAIGGKSDPVVEVINRKNALKNQILLVVEHVLNNNLDGAPLNEYDLELAGLWVSHYNGELRLWLGAKRLGYINL